MLEELARVCAVQRRSPAPHTCSRNTKHRRECVCWEGVAVQQGAEVAGGGVVCAADCCRARWRPQRQRCSGGTASEGAPVALMCLPPARITSPGTQLKMNCGLMIIEAGASGVGRAAAAKQPAGVAAVGGTNRAARARARAAQSGAFSPTAFPPHHHQATTTHLFIQLNVRRSKTLQRAASLTLGPLEPPASLS